MLLSVFWVTGHCSTPPENWTVRAFLQLTPRLSNDFTAAWLTFTFPQLFAVAATLKSIDYNVAMKIILNNNNNNNYYYYYYYLKCWLQELRKYCNAGNYGFQYKKMTINNSVNFHNFMTEFCTVVAKLFSIISCKFCLNRLRCVSILLSNL